MQVVHEVESGELRYSLRNYGIQSHATILGWLRKHATFDRECQMQQALNKTPEQRILELEQKVKLLEQQKASLDKAVDIAQGKAIFSI